jgi:hypothetical protein
VVSASAAALEDAGVSVLASALAAAGGAPSAGFGFAAA